MRLLSSLLFIAIIINNIVIKSRITATPPFKQIELGTKIRIWENYISAQNFTKTGREKIIFDPFWRHNLSGQLTILELTFF